MISSGKEYKPYSYKIFSKEEKETTSFSVCARGKEKSQNEWYNVIVQGSYPADKDSGFEFTISKINSVSYKSVNGKTYVSLFCDINVTQWGTVVPESFHHPEVPYSEENYNTPF